MGGSPLLAAMWCFVGCGAIKGNPQLDSAGIGSKTLTVKAVVTASNNSEDGSSDSNKFTTNFQVDIMRSELPVIDADVKFSGSFGGISLTPETLDSGRYVFTIPGYYSVYTLSIQAGNDYIENAFCTSPDIHVITYPTVGTTYITGTDLTVTWTRATTAENVVVSTSDFDSSKEGNQASDTGTYTIPSTLWSSTSFTETVKVTRGNTVALTDSAAGDSFMRIQVTNSVKFSVGQ